MNARTLLSFALLALLAACAPSLEAPARGPCGAAGQRCCRPGEAGGALSCAPGLACDGDPLELSTCSPCPAGQSVCDGRCAAACLDASPDVAPDLREPPDLGPEAAPDAPPEAAACPTPGLTFCAAAGCVNAQTNSEHCGACDRACNPGEVCRAGACQCAVTGQSFCPGVGCTNLATDALNCGACGAACPGGQACASGACACPIAGQTYCAGAGCVNLATDALHCGACGTACPEGRVCSGGACRCPAGLAACGEVCADLASSNLHCGACGANCAAAFPHALAVCLGGGCVQVACAPGYADCGAAAGCEVGTAADPDHCGACNARCRFPNARARCDGGACALDACDPGFADCNGAPADGCEVNVAADPANCGACGTRCTAPTGRTATCVAGACVVGATCAAPLADCDGMAPNGCEQNTLTSPTACGGCGRACNATNGTPTCAGGACAAIACRAGFGDCDASLANGCEAEFAVNGRNCGRCGAVCSFAHAAATCAAGVCRLGTCVTGFGNCDGAEANGCETVLETSAAHCGACGRACVGGASCAAGECACPAGQIACGAGASAVCVNLQTSSAHCGVCGAACPAGQGCVAGACRAPLDAGADAAADAPADVPRDADAAAADVPRDADAAVDAADAGVDVPRDVDAAADAADVPRDVDAAMDAPRDAADGG